MSQIQSTFTELVNGIQATHQELITQAGRAVNMSLTLRNWLIGCHIAEYELKGLDRVTYGSKLLFLLAKELG